MWRVKSDRIKKNTLYTNKSFLFVVKYEFNFFSVQ